MENGKYKFLGHIKEKGEELTEANEGFCYQDKQNKYR